MAKKKIQKPLNMASLMEAIAGYNEKIFIPELKKIFATKKEFSEFKNDTQTSFDKIFKKLDTLLAEKIVREYQEEKEKKL